MSPLTSHWQASRYCPRASSGSHSLSASLGGFKACRDTPSGSTSILQLPHLPRPPQIDLMPTPAFPAAVSSCSPAPTSKPCESGRIVTRGIKFPFSYFEEPGILAPTPESFPSSSPVQVC